MQPAPELQQSREAELPFIFASVIAWRKAGQLLDMRSNMFLSEFCLDIKRMSLANSLAGLAALCLRCL